MSAQDNRPFVVIRLADRPGSFPLTLDVGRELLQRVQQVEADPPAELADRVQACADAREPFAVDAADGAVFLAALRLPPELEIPMLIELRDVLGTVTG